MKPGKPTFKRCPSRSRRAGRITWEWSWTRTAFCWLTPTSRAGPRSTTWPLCWATPQQTTVEKLFPAIAQWVGDGHIEIGDQEMFGFVVRALDYGGVVYEDDKPDTLAEAMASLEKGLRKWFDEQAVELD